MESDGQRNIIMMETDQNDGASLVLNVGYLDQRETGNADRCIQRAATEDSSDTG